MKYILILSLFLFACKDKTPPPVNPPTGSQWFCKTIADLPGEADTLHGMEPYQRAVGYKNKWWPVGYAFKVGFIGGTTIQKTLVKTTCVEWSKSANLTFTFPTAGPYDIRVSFDESDGAWSYVGIDNKSIPQSEATLNLGWWDNDVIWHEFGHAIGLLHEHQNPETPIKWNEAAVIASLSGSPNYWSEETIRYNVLNPYPLANVITTALDRKSIMMYSIPSSWTLDGFSSPGGGVISDVDRAFIGARYPFAEPPTTGNVTLRKGQVDSLITALNRNLSQFDSMDLELKRLNELTRKHLGR